MEREASKASVDSIHPGSMEGREKWIKVCFEKFPLA
jgi:hypothetical protein